MNEQPINPPRGCGNKKANAFYAESGAGSPAGGLNLWTWMLDHGVSDSNSLYVRFPPRQNIIMSPVFLLVMKSLHIIEADFPTARSFPLPVPNGRTTEFGEMAKRIRTIGAGDHIGSEHYPTPISFANEAQDVGISRRLTPKLAEKLYWIIKNTGPIPVIFSHSSIPVFKNTDERNELFEIAMQFYPAWYAASTPVYGPTWEQENWGMYSYASQDTGSQHYLIPIFHLQHLISTAAVIDGELMLKAHHILSKLRYTEMPFGSSWLTKVSYTLPEGEETLHPLADKLKDLNIIDLKETEISSTEVINE